jgi:hypothetical protein
MMKKLILSLILFALSPSAHATRADLRVSWYGAVETVSAERVILKNEEGRFSLSKRLIAEARPDSQGAAGPRAGEYFELELPLSVYLGKVEKNRGLYLVKELGRMPASAN